MKTAKSLVSLALLLFAATPVFALDMPTVDSVKTPYYGSIQTITGTSVAGATIRITGNQFEIPSVIADEEGKFSIQLMLNENQYNHFYIWAELNDEISFQETFTIKENREEAIAYGKLKKIDTVAPNQPLVTQPKEAVDAYHYNISGTAEPYCMVEITGSATDKIKASVSGGFSTQVKLKQNATNVFYLQCTDEAGNPSSITTLKIREQGSSKDEDDIRVVIDETAGVNAMAPIVAKEFKDIKNNEFKEYINKLRLQGSIQGYPDGTFKPDNLINRAELLKIGSLAFGLNVLTEAGTAPFTDVPKSSWYARFIETAKEERMITGYSDHTFKPEQFVNKAEAMKILLNLSRVPFDPNPSAMTLFVNIDESKKDEWYYPYLHFLKSKGVLDSYTNKELNLSENINRGEVAKIIVMIQNLINE